jgi:hypothetical protein
MAKIFKHRIPVSIYNTHAVLCVVTEMQDMQNYIDKRANILGSILDAEGCVFEMLSPKGVDYYIVLLEKALSHNLISHELYHLTNRITKDIEITDEESGAWLSGFLAEKIYKVLQAKNYKIQG